MTNPVPPDAPLRDEEALKRLFFAQHTALGEQARTKLGADAIALAGLKQGVDGEVFNVVDDDLPSSREFLYLYKKNVRKFASLYLPHFASYGLCYLWEKYSTWSQGQLPPAFTRKKWYAYWKKTRYSNQKLKSRLGWTPQVSMAEALRCHFESCRYGERHA